MIKWLAIFLTGLAVACSAPTDGQHASEQETADENLHIHFQGGFYQDTVMLFHGSEKIYENVLTTREDSGFTDKLSIPKASVTDALHFRVQKGGQTLEGSLPSNTDQYIGFFLSSGQVVNIYSKDTPFVYENKGRQSL
jgi:hypothetical protein